MHATLVGSLPKHENVFASDTARFCLKGEVPLCLNTIWWSSMYPLLHFLVLEAVSVGDNLGAIFN